MSFSGGGVTSGNPQLYFCHQCNRTVNIVPPSSSELLCPNCNGGFLEELESPIPNPNPIHPFLSFNSDFASGGGASGIGGTFPFLFSGGDDLSTLFGGGSPNAAAADAFNPFVFLQNYIQTLRAGGANVQFVIENSGDGAGGGGGFRFPGNLTHGDYFFGPGLEELIQHLAENDPNRYGTPPASKSAVEGLPDVSVTEELLELDSSQCAVCIKTFKLGESVKQMPCKHIYHSHCILPWLELHNSCPICRYELPTDDQDYEQRARSGGGPPAAAPVSRAAGPGGLAESSGGNGGGGGGGGDGDDNRQVLERRVFRVSLPWPFRQFASSSAETSNNNNSNNNSSGNNSGQSNSEGRGNQNFESGTRQEDLD